MFVDADGKFAFGYKRTPAVVSAYGEDFTLPVRNAEFLEKLIGAESKINSSDDIITRAEALKKAVAIFIGCGAADRIFPDVRCADLDEMQAFYLTLANAVKQKSLETIKENYCREDIFR